MVITDKDYILGFMNGTSADFKSRTYADILASSDEELEECHDQVQHIFPLHEHSNMAVKTYPLLSKEVVEEGKQDKAVIANLLKAKDRFEIFYGIGKHNNPTRHSKWCRHMNHNLLRITRIIRSLRLFGLEDEAKEFYENVLAAESNYQVSPVTKGYWWRAVNEDVWKTLR